MLVLNGAGQDTYGSQFQDPKRLFSILHFPESHCLFTTDTNLLQAVRLLHTVAASLCVFSGSSLNQDQEMQEIRTEEGLRCSETLGIACS